ncbi:Sec-independent protein translocase family protein [Frondihabitans cladoniiphilus]|uniref:Twin-arginine translocase TatA/TatE family subunit n=1 Tax=Frondihabitans cladoniiphilus TaxID=715785 RepID=A0ABP8VSR7_9MICO
MFSPDKLIVIAFIAVILLGPTRLPVYAQKLARLVKTVRGMADNAKDRMRDEMGDDFDDVDWQKLDPRQYDPRRIIRDALLDEPAVPVTTKASASMAVSEGLTTRAAPPRIVPLAIGEAPPYDNEAT